MKNFTFFIKTITIASTFLLTMSLMGQTVIISDNFNSNFGNWNSGGDDANLYNSSPVDGSRAVQLRDNSGWASSMYSNALNLTPYGAVYIEFDFHTWSFNNGHNFYIEYSSNGGGTWSVLRNYIHPTDFTNNTDYFNETITITSGDYAFTNNVRFRIRADAANDNDRLFIDNVVITGFNPSPEINVQGNGFDILNGDTNPNTSDNTNYGSSEVATTITRTFTIQNTGSAALNISNIYLTNPTDFTIVAPFYNASVGANSTTTFSIRYNSLSAGVKSTYVVIDNNDADEDPYFYIIEAESQTNFFDSDGDGILDNIDIDDDNDGIRDADEELACKNSNISMTTNYKFLNEDFGTGGRTTINTTYNAVTTYCYEDGTSGTNTFDCPSQSSIDLNDGKYVVYYRAANGGGGNNTPNGEVSSWADQYWYTGEDHTPGDNQGRMAMFNASYDPGLFYTASIRGSLPNVPITYSFWVLNLDTTAAPGIGTRLRPNILVEFRDVDNNLLHSFVTPDIPPSINGNPAGSWHNFSADLTFSVSEFNVFFINNEVGGLGNDLAIDDVAITQTLCDTDNDGVADVFDLDSDNDGIPDVVEAGLGNYSQGKATLTNTGTWVDNNNNGMHDLAEGHITLDSDGDGTPNYIDLDSDNDSIFDVDESGAGNTADVAYQNGDGDIDGDGVGDGLDTDEVREKDFNSDGASEYFTDGILDIYDYYNGASMASAYGNNNQGLGNTYYVVDSDGDGTPDYIDTTSDGSTYDISHTLYASLDGNNDGVIDGVGDAEGDGILDLFDTDDAIFGSPRVIDRKLHLYFDGRNDYAEDSPILGGMSETSMMGWFKVDASSSGNQILFGQNSSMYLMFRSTNRLYARANGSVIQSAVLPKGQWIHVAATYSASQGRFALYVNGEQVGNNSVSGNLSADATLFTMGKRSNVDSWYLKGFLDEVRIFNKALSEDEIHKMVYQEIENNGGTVRGRIIPRDITDYVDSSNINPLAWNSLLRYYRLDSYRDDIIDDLTTPAIDVSGARIYNTKLINVQSAPMPFITQQSGDLATAVNNAADGVNGADATTYDWSIVQVKHKAVTFSGNQKHLGLFIDETDLSSIPIEYSVEDDSELNVSWYLKLDGFIDLDGESQLVQGDDSMLDPTSRGRIEKDQQGTADTYTYNYWSSPIGAQNATSNNNNYTLSSGFKDGSSAATPTDITFVTSNNGTSGSPIGISRRWLYKFNNLPDDDYSAWSQINQNTPMLAGEGYTMKGPGTGPISAEQNYVFNGKPNNGDISLTLNANNDYLIGNPYPSAIDAVTFINDNGPTIDGGGPGITGTLYFWEHWGGGSHNLADYQGGYATYNLSGATPAAALGTTDPDVGTGGTPTKLPGRYIPVSQGFFVVGENNGTIRFNNSQRVFHKESSGNSVFVRQSSDVASSEDSENVDPRMKFRIGFNSVNVIHRQLLLTIDENATIGYDWGYDGKLYEEQMDDLFWMIDDEKFTIQGSDVAELETVYPIGIKTNTAGLNTITIDALKNVPDTIDIFIHDIVNDTYHNLRASGFGINLPAGEYLDRFEMTFRETGESLSVSDEELNTLDVYYSNETESIVLLNPNYKDIKSIELFNILGQSIRTIENISELDYSEYEVKQLSTGTYVIKLHTESGSVSKQVLVK